MALNLTENFIENISTSLKPKNVKLAGKVSKYDGNLLECDGFPANIGALCEVETDTGALEKAEIVGFKNGSNCLSLFQTGAQVKFDRTDSAAPVIRLHECQISLKWLVQSNIPAIPRSRSPVHLQQNAEIFDFEFLRNYL